MFKPGDRVRMPARPDLDNATVVRCPEAFLHWGADRIWIRFDSDGPVSVPSWVRPKSLELIERFTPFQERVREYLHRS